MTAPSVFLAIPNTGWIHKNVAEFLLSVAKDGLHVALPVHVPIEFNRNKIVYGV